MAMERHPGLVQRPLYRQVDLGESVKAEEEEDDRYKCGRMARVAR
jgi:hypothetical protein